MGGLKMGADTLEADRGGVPGEDPPDLLTASTAGADEETSALLAREADAVASSRLAAGLVVLDDVPADAPADTGAHGPGVESAVVTAAADVVLDVDGATASDDTAPEVELAPSGAPMADADGVPFQRWRMPVSVLEGVRAGD